MVEQLKESKAKEIEGISLELERKNCQIEELLREKEGMEEMKVKIEQGDQEKNAIIERLDKAQQEYNDMVQLKEEEIKQRLDNA